MIESLAVAGYTNSIIRSDTVLKTMFSDGNVPLYSEGAPHGAGTGPYIVFNVPGGADSNTLDGNRYLACGDMNIVACIQDKGYGAIRDIANRIDSIMTGTTQIQNGGVFITRFVRTASIMFSDDNDDMYWYFLGGMYRADVFAYSGPDTYAFDPGGAFGASPFGTVVTP